MFLVGTMFFLIAAYIFLAPQLVFGDSRCLARNGICQNSNTYSCPGVWVSQLCSGATHRRCCIPVDPKCLAKKGQCHYISTSCSGTYKDDLCYGPSTRKCCVPPTGCTKIRYGDIRVLRPTGASSRTASQDRISYSGVPASNQLVANDYTELNKRKHCYYKVSKALCIHPALVAALASRESRAGRLLYGTYGWGDCRNGQCRAYGILQCDIHSSGLGKRCTSHSWYSCEHMEMMIREVLMNKLRGIQRKFPSWPPERQLQGAVAAYNFGVSNVQTWGGLDVGTTGNDYSNDVIARAQHLINHFDWK